MKKGGNGGGANKLFGADGRPISSKPAGIAVLKIPKGVPPPSPQGMQAIVAVTRCNVIIIPMDCELMMGEIAEKELKSIHIGIHQILGIEEGEK
mgnify:CR=1 FL=1